MDRPGTTAGTARPIPFWEKLQRRLRARNPYNRTLSPVTVLFRFIAAAMALALGIALLTLTGYHPVRQFTDWVGHVRGSGRLTLETFGPPDQTNLSGARPVPRAEWAIDGIRNRGWTIPFTEQNSGASNSECTPLDPGQVTPQLVIPFAAAQDIREIGFQTGYTDLALRNDRWQPKIVELQWTNGKCQRVDLAKNT